MEPSWDSPSPITTASAPSGEAEAEGEVRKVVLDNGLTLLLKRLPDYGMVDADAAFHGGVIYETEATNGLFFLMANTFWRGTESRPFPQLVQLHPEEALLAQVTQRRFHLQHADPLERPMDQHLADRAVERRAVKLGDTNDEETFVLSGLIGGERVVDMLSGEQLPRIC